MEPTPMPDLLYPKLPESLNDLWVNNTKYR